MTANGDNDEFVGFIPRKFVGFIPRKKETRPEDKDNGIYTGTIAPSEVVFNYDSITITAFDAFDNPNKISKRAKDWINFSHLVLDHIENYTVPQYGDKGSDLCSEYTVEECLRQAEKYIKRYGKNSRPGQEKLDFFKAAHFIQMAFEKFENKKEE